jgi:hypothetical protein
MNPAGKFTCRFLSPTNFVTQWLRQRDGAPKLLGSKFIKQASSNTADLSPKAEPQEQGGLLYIPYRAGYRNGGYSLSHKWSHAISLSTLTIGVR